MARSTRLAIPGVAATMEHCSRSLSTEYGDVSPGTRTSGKWRGNAASASI